MISSYFKSITQYSTLRFILEVTALAFVSRFVIVIPAALILSALGVDLGNPNIVAFNFNKDFIPLLLYICVIAPFIETLIFQWIPLTIFKWLHFNINIAIIITTLIFAYAHLYEGLINFVGMIPIGFLLVWAFSVRRNKSTWNAIFTTFAIHGLTNLTATILYLFTQ